MLEISKPEIVGVVLTLVSVIGSLWGIIISWMKTNSTRLKKYEEKQEQNQQEIKDLTGNMNYLKGQMEGISNLSKSVLNEISKLKYPNDNKE